MSIFEHKFSDGDVIRATLDNPNSSDEDIGIWIRDDACYVSLSFSDVVAMYEHYTKFNNVSEIISPKVKSIPITAAKNIAKKYGYEQIVILGRHPSDDNGTEHLTTYGINKLHCGIAARMGRFLKYKVLGWEENDELS